MEKLKKIKPGFWLTYDERISNSRLSSNLDLKGYVVYNLSMNLFNNSHMHLYLLYLVIFSVDKLTPT